MIVSIYLKQHSFLTNEPQTINFGGAFIYEYKEHKRSLIVYRHKNDKYVPDFFSIARANSKISLLSAIVGENGTGKSSVLNVLRSLFIQHEASMPSSISLVLVEINGEPYLLHSDYDHVELFDDFLDGTYTTIKSLDKNEYQSIYYSPHFDLKYNFNFDEIDKYDISLDQYIKDDLLDIEKKGSNENGWRFNGHQELTFKNTLRQVEFMTSDLFTKNDFLSSFNLPEYQNVKVYFRDIEVDEKFWNMPGQFREEVRDIKEKINREMDNWHKIRKFDDNHKVLNQRDINHYLLKRFIINAILSVIIRMMEEKNSYFNNGFLDGYINQDWNAEKSFLEFIKISHINFGDSKSKIFNSEVYVKLFTEIDKLFKGDITGGEVSTKSIDLPMGKIKSLLNLHREAVKGFFNYYGEKSTTGLNLYEFLGVHPIDQNMSSGELALFNFFSRLHYFIVNQLEGQNPRLEIKKNFILLLDEADLAFHPVWKKKFVNTILKTIPFFFDQLGGQINLQVIITTHDPLTLSDLPISNVVFLRKDGIKTKVIHSTEKDKIQKTFGANITELLSNSFFLTDGLIGDFAKSKIEEVITFINTSKNHSDEMKQSAEFQKKLEHYKSVISIIDERVVKLKLTEMITDILPDDYYRNRIIYQEIDFLRKKLK